MISTPASFARRLDRRLRLDPPRARSLLVTVFGDALAERGGGAWLGTLIQLLAPFGINERLVRSGVFRLQTSGWLAAERVGRRSRYRFTASGRRRFQLAHNRIYFRRPQPWDGTWTMLLGAPPAPLRRELGWLGFRPLTGGLLGHPSPDPAALRELLDRFPRARLAPFLGVGLAPLPRAWRLAAVATEWRRFLRRFQPFAAAASRLPPAEAFRLRTLLIHDYRRASLHDPQLPAGFLPPRWPAAAAYQLTRDIYRQALAASERHLRQLLGGSAGPALRRRFQS